MIIALALGAPLFAQESPPPDQAQQPAPDQSAPAPQAVAPAIAVQAPEEKKASDRGKPKNGEVELEDIEVTASKRAKSERDLPGSIGAIRGADLESMKAQGLSDYLKLIPGVTMADYGTGEQIPVIRGIAADTGGLGTQFTSLTTGIFLDDMPFNDLFLPTSVPDLNPFDLERVEVLKGPQGTLFGAGALAGAIRYIVQKPNHSVWETKLSQVTDVTRGSANPTQAGAINIPLFGDALAIRVVGLYRRDNGYHGSRANHTPICSPAPPPAPPSCSPSPDGGNLREENNIDRLMQQMGRVLASWNVTDRFKVSGFVFAQNYKKSDDGWSDTPDELTRNDTPFPAPSAAAFGGGNTLATFDLDWAQILYTGNYLRKSSLHDTHQENQTSETAAQHTTAWYNFFRARTHGVTHELRLASPQNGSGFFEWTVGAAYFREFAHFFQYEPAPGPNNQSPYPNPPTNPDQVSAADRANSVLWATVDGSGKEEALFGDVTARLSDRWEASIGARRFRIDMPIHTDLEGAEISALTQSSKSVNDMDAREGGLDPKFSLRYVHNANVQMYALAAKGFQFGGFQLNPPLVGIQQQAQAEGFNYGPYKSSKLWDYECGFRTEWLERRLRFDTTFYYLDWKDLQLNIQVPINPQPLPFPSFTGLPSEVGEGLTVNVGRAHSMGIESALEVIPFTGAKWTSSAAWMHAVTDVAFDNANSAGPVPAGTRLPGAPRFQWSNVVSYEHMVPGFEAWTVGPAFTQATLGESPNSLRSNGDVGGYTTFDVRIALIEASSPSQPEFSIGMNNITDVRGVSASVPIAPISEYFIIRPRTLLASVSFKY